MTKLEELVEAILEDRVSLIPYGANGFHIVVAQKQYPTLPAGAVTVPEPLVPEPPKVQAFGRSFVNVAVH